MSLTGVLTGTRVVKSMGRTKALRGFHGLATGRGAALDAVATVHAAHPGLNLSDKPIRLGGGLSTGAFTSNAATRLSLALSGAKGFGAQGILSRRGVFATPDFMQHLSRESRPQETHVAAGNGLSLVQLTNTTGPATPSMVAAASDNTDSAPTTTAAISSDAGAEILFGGKTFAQIIASEKLLSHLIHYGLRSAQGIILSTTFGSESLLLATATLESPDSVFAAICGLCLPVLGILFTGVMQGYINDPLQRYSRGKIRANENVEEALSPMLTNGFTLDSIGVDRYLAKRVSAWHHGFLEAARRLAATTASHSEEDISVKTNILNAVIGMGNYKFFERQTIDGKSQRVFVKLPKKVDPSIFHNLGDPRSIGYARMLRVLYPETRITTQDIQAIDVSSWGRAEIESPDINEIALWLAQKGHTKIVAHLQWKDTRPAIEILEHLAANEIQAAKDALRPKRLLQNMPPRINPQQGHFPSSTSICH